MGETTRAAGIAVVAALVTVAGAGSAQAPAEPVRQLFGVMVPMRDGVKLATDLWMPAKPGRYPVILIRTPYLKSMPEFDVPTFGQYYARRGYVFAVQDVRGRGDSDGSFDFFFQEGPDGFDAIEWLARQPYANGRVGTMGVSYLGTVQWLAARLHPPALKCMAPTAPAGRWLEELPFQGGAFMHQWALGWLADVMGKVSQRPNLAGTDWNAVLDHRPLLTADSALGRSMRLYREFLTHPIRGPYWQRIQFGPDDFRGIRIPTLTTTGWFDGDQPGALYYWRNLMQYAPNKAQHFLLAGPWNHVQTFLGGATTMADLSFTADAVVDNKALHAAFFDWCLKQTAASFDFPRAKVYVTGANEWRSFETYPPPSAAPATWYFSSGGRAATAAGDGRLAQTPPGDEPPDHFSYDPKHPFPAEKISGEDRRELEARPDVLVYSSDALAEPVDIIGTVTVDVEAATDGRDTDFTAILVDVGPDGKAIKLGPEIGIRRGRYRNGPTAEVLMTPGKPETFKIELYDIAHRFLPGHRIRVEVSSSAAPMFNPNQNTGNPVATDTVWRTARQTVYHDRTRASKLTLPVVPARAVP